MNQQKNLKSVIHLIPYHGIGGVERAASTMTSIQSCDFDFQIGTIFLDSAAFSRWTLWNPLHFLRTIVRLWQAHSDILIVSLWRAYFIGIIIKWIRPSTSLVVFLHSTFDAHIVDRFFTRLAARLASQVWGDSQATLDRRLPSLSTGKGCVISFVTEKIKLPETRVSVSVKPVFIFWGRIHPQKALQRAIHLFARIHFHFKSARFMVIGPDGGDLAALKQLVVVLGIAESVDFMGAMRFEDIQREAAKASFYLQTSEREGMAMSVVEAMQLGLVPVVTRVGEIAQYAQHGNNSIVVCDDSEAVKDVIALIEDDERYQTVRQRAIAVWSDHPLYRDSVLAACSSVLGCHKKCAVI